MVRSIRTKLILGFLTISLLLSSVSLFGYSKYAEQGTRLKQLANEDIVQLQSILKLNYMFQQKADSARAYATLQDDIFAKKMETFRKRTRKLLTQIADETSKEHDPEKQKKYRGYINLLTDLHNRYDTKLDQMVQARVEGNNLLSDQRYKETDSIAVQIGLTADSWASAVEQEVNNELTSAQKDTASTLVNTAFFIIISTMLAIAAGLYLGIKMSRPIKLLSESTKLIAQGNLNIVLPEIKSRDEVGQLYSNFGQLLVNLRTVIAEMSSTSTEVSRNADVLFEKIDGLEKNEQCMSSTIEQVDKGITEQTTRVREAMQVIGQLNLAIEQISTGAFNQTEQIGKASTTVGHMAAKINQVAENAIEVKKAAEHTFNFAQKGGIAVNNSIKGMEQIKLKVSDTAQRIHELGEQSKQIGAIIEVIDAIADQTNLLALNAAIEAARAGTHGKGFAVVADEVRNLAEKSGDATKQIAQLVTNIQNITKNLIVSMQEGTSEVEKGAALAVDAGSALEDIINTMELTLKQVENISESTEQIAKNSNTVVSTIENIAGISQENAASTEQMTASSQQVVDIVDQISYLSQDEHIVVQKTSTSVNEMNRSVHQISGSATELSKMAEKLNHVVNSFKL